MSGYHAKTHFPLHFCTRCCDDNGKQVIKNDSCINCHGTGKPCELCHGTGTIKEEIRCTTCNHVCKVIEKPCPNLKK